MFEQYMHFIELKLQLKCSSEGSVMIKTFAYLFSAEEQLPPGTYEAVSCTGDAAACARLFVGCRDDNTFAFRSKVSLVDHTKGNKILQALFDLELERNKKEGEQK